MVVTDMCSCSEISKALGIHVKNVQRYTKALREKGAGWFFNREDHRGQCHKFTPWSKEKAQELINMGYSQQATAQKLG